MESGQLASVVVTFIEDRNGRALVRLPNGSKTSISYDVLAPHSARGHFVPSPSGSSTAVYCLDCDWSTTEPLRPDAQGALMLHAEAHHQ
jgi:hypothetical protein